MKIHGKLWYRLRHSHERGGWYGEIGKLGSAESFAETRTRQEFQDAEDDLWSAVRRHERARIDRERDQRVRELEERIQADD